jgi:uncharacterized membrane protein
MPKPGHSIRDKWFGIFAESSWSGFLRVFTSKRARPSHFQSLFHAKPRCLYWSAYCLSTHCPVHQVACSNEPGFAPAVSADEHKRIMVVLRAELVLLLAMALCASLMARAVSL